VVCESQLQPPRRGCKQNGRVTLGSKPKAQEASLGKSGVTVIAMCTSPKWDSPSGVAYIRRHLIPSLHRSIWPSIWSLGDCNAMSEMGQKRKSGAGVIVDAVRYNGTIHDFVVLNALRNVPSTEAAIDQINAGLRQHLELVTH
jgi:hypothetical protein